MRARIWTGMAWSAALAAVLASASGCAVANANGELTANGRFWSKAGRFTDRLTVTEPYIHPEAHLADTPYAGDPPAPCPREATAGTLIETLEPVYE